MGCTGESPATCPAGTVGTPYSLPVFLQDDDPWSCAVFRVSSGTFPPGLSLAPYASDSTKGSLISGTPTQPGTYRFYISYLANREASCGAMCGNKCQSDDEFIIPINPGAGAPPPAPPKLTLGPETTTPGTTGTPYSLQMTASVSDAKTFSISAGALPPGLAINSSTGLISGTPTAAGTFDFTVYAKVNADSRSDTKARGDHRSRPAEDHRVGAVLGHPQGSGRGRSPVRRNARRNRGPRAVPVDGHDGSTAAGTGPDRGRDLRNPHGCGQLRLHRDRDRFREPHSSLHSAGRRRREARRHDQPLPSGEGRQALRGQAQDDRRREAGLVEHHGRAAAKGVRFSRTLGVLAGVPKKAGRYRVPSRRPTRSASSRRRRSASRRAVAQAHSPAPRTEIHQSCGIPNAGVRVTYAPSSAMRLASNRPSGLMASTIVLATQLGGHVGRH